MAKSLKPVFSRLDRPANDVRWKSMKPIPQISAIRVANTGRISALEQGRADGDGRHSSAEPGVSVAFEKADCVRKDQSLDFLARIGNVAQFVSFSLGESGDLEQTYSRIAGIEPNHRFPNLKTSIVALLSNAASGAINIRSFAPDSARSREFIYGIRNADEALAVAMRLRSDGLHVIVNETIDVSDGGVSGVVLGQVVEFSPDDTPRCVEKPGTASLPLDWALKLLEIVYGFQPDLPDTGGRLEFSIHPEVQGWKQEHTITWEFEEARVPSIGATFVWPNNFSKMMGDKAYGLLMAHLAGLRVPRTTVISRRVAPFVFGKATTSAEVWIRTAPTEPEPGLYTTRKGWTDPFKLLRIEDPADDALASILSQAAVPARYSGAALVGIDGGLLIEGRPGEGDGLMLGRDLPEILPDAVIHDVREIYAEASKIFGPIRFEWVHDGSHIWIVQLHRGATATSAGILVPGEAAEWHDFEAGDGLEALRHRLRSLRTGDGLRIFGQIGLTSHFADLLRRAGLPARLVD